VPPYKDPAVRSAMMKIRKVMLDNYQTQITSFVDHLKERQTLRLAQQTVQTPAETKTQQPQQPQQSQPNQGLSLEGATGVAATILSTWLGLQAVEGVANTLKDLLYGIALRAGENTAKTVGLDNAIDVPALTSWSARRSQFVVNSVDSTLKSELSTFLVNQLQKSTDPDAVALAASQRFETTPNTHADRVVLAEVLPAYNFGQLTALHTAGVSQVQAHDASDGSDSQTDVECKQRDGEVLSVSQAVVEAASEHPAGTLYFTALSTDDFTMTLVESLPGNLLASYDSERETLSVLSSTTDEQRREYVVATGSALALTW
jgi:hypothetical protein